MKKLTVFCLYGVIAVFLTNLSALAAETPVAVEGFAQAGAWNGVELNYHVSLPKVLKGQVWIPMPLEHTSFQQLESYHWNGTAARTGVLRRSENSAFFFLDTDKEGGLEGDLTFRLKMKDRTGYEPDTYENAKKFLGSSEHVYIDDNVRKLAKQIVGKEKDTDKLAKKIYEWVVENTYRDPNTRGCGQGDVKNWMETKVYGGKCADIGSFAVALFRAVGVPAREVFGLRVFNSQLSKSIGKYGDVSKAQHCRMEYFTKGKGWKPLDPADVRKVILEEKLDIADVHVKEVRKKLFGFWEMNWVAFNSDRDFVLPGSIPDKVNYLMYPYFTSGSVRKDGMDPNDFKYSISSKKLNLAETEKL